MRLPITVTFDMDVPAELDNFLRSYPLMASDIQIRAGFKRTSFDELVAKNDALFAENDKLRNIVAYHSPKIRQLADENEELRMTINRIKQWARESNHTHVDVTTETCLRCKILHS